MCAVKLVNNLLSSSTFLDPHSTRRIWLRFMRSSSATDAALWRPTWPSSTKLTKPVAGKAMFDSRIWKQPLTGVSGLRNSKTLAQSPWAISKLSAREMMGTTTRASWSWACSTALTKRSLRKRRWHFSLSYKTLSPVMKTTRFKFQPKTRTGSLLSTRFLRWL